MALKKDIIAKIAALVKVDPVEFERAVTAQEEVDVTIDEELTTYTGEEVTTLRRNEYDAGKKASIEMAVKDAKVKYNLDFTGKTLDGLIDAHKVAVLKEAQIEPTKQVETLQNQVRTLQATITEQESKLSEATTASAKIKLDAQIRKHIPAGLPVDEDEFMASMCAKGITWSSDDTGNVVFSRNGQPMQNKLAQPLSAKEVIDAYQTERGWKPATQESPITGRGGNNNPPAPRAGSIGELKKQFQEAGKNIQGQEFAQAVEQHVKDNPEFNMKD